MGGEHPVRGSQRTRQLEQFLGRAEHSRRVDESAGEAAGARFEAPFQCARHCRPFPGVGRSRPQTHRAEPQEAVGDEGGHVERQAARLQRREVVGERFPAPVGSLGRHPGVDGGSEVVRLAEERRRAEPAVPDDLGGDALGEAAGDQRFAVGAAAREHQVAVRVDVHEAGRGDESVRIQLAQGLAVGWDEAAVADAEVTAVGGSARPVHDQRVPDAVVERRGVRGTFLAAGGAEEAGGEGAGELAAAGRRGSGFHQSVDGILADGREEHVAVAGPGPVTCSRVSSGGM